jgi:putative heme iron utilization protein
MPYGLDGRGSPTFLISTMAMHTQNLLSDPRCSLLVTQPGTSGEPLGASRVTLMGNVSQVEGEELKDIRERYLARHENARNWADFGDFAFYRMEVVDVYFVGGFGVMGWVAAQEYYRAEVDPLADVAPEIIGHMNQDHADSLLLIARAFGDEDAREAQMTSVDRLGFNLKLRTEDGMEGTRIAFSREVRDAQEARAVLIEMIRQAREKA